MSSGSSKKDEEEIRHMGRGERRYQVSSRRWDRDDYFIANCIDANATKQWLVYHMISREIICSNVLLINDLL